MDKTTQEIFGRINAHDALLKSLYTDAYKDNPQGLKVLEDRLTAQLKQPPRFPDPFDQETALKIQPLTQNAVWVFFRELESSIQKASLE